MESGAVGFLLKDAPAAELAAAIRRVMAGERVVDPALAASALSERGNPLTDRERDVLAASADGATIADVAARLLPLRGHRAQLPLDRHPEARRAQPGRGGAPRRAERLALGGGQSTLTAPAAESTYSEQQAAFLNEPAGAGVARRR